MKKLFFLFTILFSLPLMAQDYLDKVAENACDCVTKAKLSTLMPDERQARVGTCLLEELSKNPAELEKFKLANNMKDAELDELGLEVGMRMADTCPEALLTLTGGTKTEPEPAEVESVAKAEPKKTAEPVVEATVVAVEKTVEAPAPVVTATIVETPKTAEDIADELVEAIETGAVDTMGEEAETIEVEAVEIRAEADTMVVGATEIRTEAEVMVVDATEIVTDAAEVIVVKPAEVPTVKVVKASELMNTESEEIFSEVGIIASVKGSQFNVIDLETEDGSNLKFLWLFDFKGSHLLANNLVEKQEVRIYYKTMELYDAKKKSYINFRVLTGLETVR